jgi:hypothetical protein
VERGVVIGVARRDLGPILWNRFGRNVPQKTALVKFNFCNYDIEWL